MDSPIQLTPPDWFADSLDQKESVALGFRHEPGGIHLSKTMMLADLQQVLDKLESPGTTTVEDAILGENLLGKPTGTARKLVLSRLNTLYGIRNPLPLQAAMLKLWTRSSTGRPLLGLLCSLAREPLLRDTAALILSTSKGAALRWPDLAAPIAARHPERYSPKMLKSLAQNCASTWTQSGHIRGKVAKRRSLAEPTPEVAAYAALLGSLAGFGGPALLASPWMRILDRSEADLLTLLRRAEAAGLLQLRAGGGVIQVNVRRPLAQVLGVSALADG